MNVVLERLYRHGDLHQLVLSGKQLLRPAIQRLAHI